jgi:hypothetical protein
MSAQVCCGLCECLRDYVFIAKDGGKRIKERRYDSGSRDFAKYKLMVPLG